MSFYYKLVLDSDDAMTIDNLLEEDYEQDSKGRKHFNVRHLHWAFSSAYNNAKTNVDSNTKELELQDKDVKKICDELSKKGLPELCDKITCAANAYVDKLRATEPSYEKHNGVTISAYHLSQQTLSDYFRVKTDKDDEKKITLPPCNLPNGFQVISDGYTLSIFNSKGSHSWIDRYVHNHTNYDDDTAPPQDMIDLLRWMYDNDYDFITLTMWEERARGYSSDDLWEFIQQTETFLPFYDLDKVNTVFKSPCDTPEKRDIYKHIDVRQLGIDTTWDDDYVADDVAVLFPDVDFSKKATRRKFYHSSDEIYTAAKHVLDSTIYCAPSRARATFTDAEALADYLDQQRFYSKKAPKLKNADRHIISLDLAEQILKCVGGTAWDILGYPLRDVSAFKTYYGQSAKDMDNMEHEVPAAKAKPDRPLAQEDIILVKDFTLRGVPMKPHYFKVVEAGDDLKTPDGYDYNIACVPLYAMNDPDSEPDLQVEPDDEGSVEIPDNRLVWYTDMPVKDVYKTGSVFFNTRARFVFHYDAFNFEHHGEVFNRNTFATEK